ncbi:MAG: hypothetical protein J2P25_20145 [Nocardiopsaceae bacterium]|nr:hypothetical protein [Nocardiopsaceae bacterium]
MSWTEAFHFDVGVRERHRVDFAFDRWSGSLKIRLDGFLLDTDRLFMSVKTTRRYEFTVGQSERHAVVIEKRRKLLLAGFRKSDYLVLVDGQPVNTVPDGS